MTKFERLCLENISPYSVLIAVVLTALLFLVRPAAVIVSDDMFTAIYGVKREHYKRIEMSSRIFRRIKIVNVAIDAEAEAVAFAVEDAVKKPAFVVFPKRYMQAAQRYAKDCPKIKIFLLTESNNEPQSMEGIQILSTGTELDYYRAGLCAAVLTKLPLETEEGTKITDYNKSILLITENESDLIKGIFNTGVRKYSSDAGIEHFEKNSTDFSKIFKCVVILGYETNFLNSNKNLSTKVVAKTWLDPLYAPPNAVVIIDDSPLAILPQITKYRFRKISPAPLKANSTFIIRFDRTETFTALLALRTAVGKKL
ncbi:MAG: hypothetical protein Ta2F_12410 [Termitinemataceae bacterium]|nr:MAG: hypothetical protein Ta2F_12410 [Termitinemataceae bacterium]